MRIGLQTWGSHGDIRPFIALAQGLSTAGHEVTLLATSVDDVDYGGAVSGLPFRFQPVATPVIADHDTLLATGKIIFKEKNPLKQAKLITARLFAPAADEMYEAAAALCAENDVVIGHFFHYPLRIAATRSGCPAATVMLVHHIIETGNHPPAGMPRLGRWANPLQWWLLKTLLNRYLKPQVDRLCARHGVAPFKDLLTDVWSAPRLNLIAVSPEICARQDDWGDRHQVCGFLNTDNLENEGVVDNGLEDFLNKGAPPVYMGFGSMLPEDGDLQRQALAVFTEAAQRAGCRAIIQLPQWEQYGGQQSSDVHFVSASPHNLVFPRCAAVVHHGGSGTTHTTTAAGTPSVVVAHIAEQLFWGRELARIGVAPAPLKRSRLSAATLADKIAAVLGTPAMGDRAKVIGARMRREDGVDRAVDIIRRKLAPS
jgi:sterol 3beta-glucosyltransferase